MTSQKPRPLDRRRSRAALVSVATATGLIVLKLVTAALTGSLAIIASLVDSAMDLAASSTNFFAIRQAELPPDADHGWGHGKAESLSSLAQSLLVAASAAVLVWQSIERLVHPRPIRNVGVGVVVMLVGVVVSLLLTLFLRHAGKKYDSMALRADAVHYLSDVLTNGAAFVALVAYDELGWGFVDPVVSLVIAGILAYSAYGIGREAVDQLMDHELEGDVRDDILRRVVALSPRIFGIHELRSRQSGTTAVVDLHLEIDHTVSFPEAHDLTADVQHLIEAMLGNAIVTVHADPFVEPGVALEDACTHVLDGVEGTTTSPKESLA